MMQTPLVFRLESYVLVFAKYTVINYCFIMFILIGYQSIQPVHPPLCTWIYSLYICVHLPRWTVPYKYSRIPKFQQLWRIYYLTGSSIMFKSPGIDPFQFDGCSSKIVSAALVRL